MSRSCSVPTYCLDSPRKVCLSVPQIPDMLTVRTTAPGSGSGTRDSRRVSLPGPPITAATDLIMLDPLPDQRSPGCCRCVARQLIGQRVELAAARHLADQLVHRDVIALRVQA